MRENLPLHREVKPASNHLRSLRPPPLPHELKAMKLAPTIIVLITLSCTGSAQQDLTNAHEQIDAAKSHLLEIHQHTNAVLATLNAAQISVAKATSTTKANEETLVKQSDNFLGPAAHNLLTILFFAGIAMLAITFLFSPANLVAIASSFYRILTAWTHRLVPTQQKGN